MLNKKYLPSLGFIILLFTIISSTLFLNWALEPLSYEKAKMEEAKGHQLAKDGKDEEASEHFLNAAKIKDNNISTSRRYRCAGSTSQNEDEKIKYYKLALKYNKNNKIAEKSLEPYLKEIIYRNMWHGGWSKGKAASIKINAKEESTYQIKYFTSSPENRNFKVIILLDKNILEKKKIKRGQINKYTFTISKGLHTIDIKINYTFNPKKLRMSTDNRELGIHVEIKKLIGMK